jgi:SAM-dependent methyltransferase
MPDSFWMSEYKKKAALLDPIAQSGRGRQFEAVPFLHVVGDVLRLVQPGAEDDLLDVGCANGLMDVVLAPVVHTLLALDPVPELVDLARGHLEGIANARAEVGDGSHVPAPDSSFDSILMFGVMQLIPPAELRECFRELRRVARPGARIVLGSVADAERREAFLVPYLDGVRHASHLSDEQKAEILRRNEATHWYRADDLAGWWRDLGGEAKVAPMSPRDPDRDHRYHLIVEVPR